MVQWFKTSPSNVGGVGSVPGRGTKIPHDLWPQNQNIKWKQYCNEFNKDLKMAHKNSLKKKTWVVNNDMFPILQMRYLILRVIKCFIIKDHTPSVKDWRNEDHK